MGAWKVEILDMEVICLAEVFRGSRTDLLELTLYPEI